MTYIPKTYIEEFKEYLPIISASGYTSEGQMNKKVSDQMEKFSNVKWAIPVSSNGVGMLAVLSYYKEICGATLVVFHDNTMYGMAMVARLLGLEVAYVPSDNELVSFI